MILQPILHPALLLLLWLPIVAIAVFALVRNPRQRGLWAMRIVLLLACFALLLRPGIPGGTTQTLATDTDIVLMVDTTSSIVAEDWAEGSPRLEGVRADIQELVAEYPGARFALITFDAAAELRVPLTTDTTALTSALEVLRPEVTSRSQGSSIGIASELLTTTLEDAASASPDRSRMVFYFGDGEQTATTLPESFDSATEYVDAGVVFGYGTAQGGQMRLSSGGFEQSGGEYIQYQGRPALSVIDEAALETVASELGVEYVHRTAEEPPAFPEAPTSTRSYTESGEVGSVTEVYWIAAVVIALFLAVELTLATRSVTQMRGLSHKPKGGSA